MGAQSRRQFRAVFRKQYAEAAVDFVGTGAPNKQSLEGAAKTFKRGEATEIL